MLNNVRVSFFFSQYESNVNAISVIIIYVCEHLKNDTLLLSVSKQRRLLDGEGNIKTDKFLEGSLDSHMISLLIIWRKKPENSDTF